jgi:hypothetical protein
VVAACAIADAARDMVVRFARAPELREPLRRKMHEAEGEALGRLAGIVPGSTPAEAGLLAATVRHELGRGWAPAAVAVWCADPTKGYEARRGRLPEVVEARLLELEGRPRRLVTVPADLPAQGPGPYNLDAAIRAANELPAPAPRSDVQHLDGPLRPNRRQGSC